MSADTAVLAGRTAAERLMLDAGTALRPTGRTYVPDQQAEVDTYSELFSSPCKIQAGRLVARDQEVGGRTATTVRLELHLPVSTDPLAVGDVWEVTFVGPLSTVPEGVRYRVTAPVEGSLKTARRYEIERVTS